MSIRDEIVTALRPHLLDKTVKLYLSAKGLRELVEAEWRRIQPVDTPARQFFNIPLHATRSVEEIEEGIMLYTPDLFGHPLVITENVERFRVGE